MGTMGVMSAALGCDCSECHTNAGTYKVDWAADTQKKVMARRMTVMAQTINKQNFSGRQMVTCWSCHHGRDRPSTTPSMETVYGPASMETDDYLTRKPGQPEAAAIINKYVNALGGAEKLSAIKSCVAKGTSVGFGGFGGRGQVQIYAKFPDERATYIEFAEATGRGDSIRTTNGKTAWIVTPLTILGRYEMTGGELDGAKLDAELGFPQQITKALTDLRVSLPTTISDLPGPSSQTDQQAAAAGIGKDRLVNVVQGTGPNGVLATMYFDQESGLLLRVVRLAKSPMGRVPTNVDYSDYRDVNGVKFPFRITFAWLDGRDAIQLTQVQTNVAIDEATFGRPGFLEGKIEGFVKYHLAFLTAVLTLPCLGESFETRYGQEKTVAMPDRKSANGCILSRSGKLKMEIPDKCSCSGSAPLADFEATMYGRLSGDHRGWGPFHGGELQTERGV